MTYQDTLSISHALSAAVIYQYFVVLVSQAVVVQRNYQGNVQDFSCINCVRCQVFAVVTALLANLITSLFNTN